MKVDYHDVQVFDSFVSIHLFVNFTEQELRFIDVIDKENGPWSIIVRKVFEDNDLHLIVDHQSFLEHIELSSQQKLQVLNYIKKHWDKIKDKIKNKK